MQYIFNRCTLQSFNEEKFKLTRAKEFGEGLIFCHIDEYVYNTAIVVTYLPFHNIASIF